MRKTITVNLGFLDPLDSWTHRTKIMYGVHFLFPCRSSSHFCIYKTIMHIQTQEIPFKLEIDPRPMSMCNSFYLSGGLFRHFIEVLYHRHLSVEFDHVQGHGNFLLKRAITLCEPRPLFKLLTHSQTPTYSNDSSMPPEFAKQVAYLTKHQCIQSDLKLGFVMTIPKKAKTDG